MPTYMDVHLLPGVKAGDVAAAHQLDLGLQDQHGCRCMTYWIDEERENVFCLIEAPDKDSVIKLHGAAHGLIPNRIIEVDQDLVKAFLGRIHDPDKATEKNGLKVFEDPSYRYIVLLRNIDKGLLIHRKGRNEALTFLREYELAGGPALINYNNRKNIRARSFRSAGEASEFLKEIHKKSWSEELGITSVLTAGEPVEKEGSYFNECFKLTGFLGCTPANGIIISNVVANYIPETMDFKKSVLTASEENTIIAICSLLESEGHMPEFHTGKICDILCASRSAVYRITTKLFDLSPNDLINHYRLHLSLPKLWEKQRIGEVAYESGFNSASYFSKLFRQHFGLQPMEYSGLRDEFSE